jgi:hypothetical protein
VGRGASVRDIDVTQTINSQNQASGELSSSAIAKMQSDVDSSLSAALDQATKANNDIGSTGNATSDNASSIKNALSAAVTNTITVDNYQKMVQSTIDKNGATLTILGDARDIKIDQNIVANVISRNIMKSIIDQTNSSLASSNTGVQITQSATSATTGVGSIFQGLFDLVGGIFGNLAAAYIVLPLVCLCCCCIVVLAFLVLSSGGGKPSVTTAPPLPGLNITQAAPTVPGLNITQAAPPVPGFNMSTLKQAAPPVPGFNMSTLKQAASQYITPNKIAKAAQIAKYLAV